MHLWVDNARLIEMLKPQFITGCLFHGLQFESQHELKTENLITTWQVTMIWLSVKNEWVKKLKMITQACQRTCYATDGCVAFQYSLDDSRHSIICLSHLVLFYNIYSLYRDCKLLASPTSGKKIRGNYLTGLPKCPSGKTNPKCRGRYLSTF